MRRLLQITLIASLLTGCAAAPNATLGTVRQSKAATPSVRVVTGGPSVTVTANAEPEAAAVSQASAEELLAADANMDSIELLIQDGGAYFQVQGWFTDLKESIKRAWTRWKLSREVKAALKKNKDAASKLYGQQISDLRDARVGLKTEINDLEEGAKEIVQTWKSTHQGTFDIETRRTVDDEGVIQVSSVEVTGKNAKGLGVELSRVRTLTGTDGTYKVATQLTMTQKDGRKDYQEWLKVVAADGSEKITGFMNHRDGHRTEFTGTRDTKGKVKVDLTKIAPAK